MLKSKIKIEKNGRYIISGNVPISLKIIGRGNNEDAHFPQKQVYSLCRCGKSKNAPYCDGTHIKIGFNGTETASRKNFSERIVNKIEGPELDLLDDGRCAYARFCHTSNGDTWNLTRSSNITDNKKDAIKSACD